MPVATGGGRLKVFTPAGTCETVATSVGAMPGATLTMRRRKPASPTETVWAVFATEPKPSATAFVAVA